MRGARTHGHDDDVGECDERAESASSPRQYGGRTSIKTFCFFCRPFYYSVSHRRRDLLPSPLQKEVMFPRPLTRPMQDAPPPSPVFMSHMCVPSRHRGWGRLKARADSQRERNQGTPYPHFPSYFTCSKGDAGALGGGHLVAGVNKPFSSLQRLASPGLSMGTVAWLPGGAALGPCGALA